MRLDDLVLFAKLAELQSFSAAARALGVPKQTLSRRVMDLEASLKVPLIQRTTRKVRLTEAGSAYAVRCQEIARLAKEANDAISSQSVEVSGLLRVTADSTFGDVFVWPLLSRFAKRFPAVEVDLVLTNRFVDLVEEGIDVAFRVGRLNDASLVGRRLGPARLCFCASPAYLKRRGTPGMPEDLAEHDLIDFTTGREPSRWPFLGADGMYAVPIVGKVRVNSLAVATRAAQDGFGIVNLPQFAAEPLLASGALVAILSEFTADVGSVHVVYPRHRFLVPRVRRFIDLVFEQDASSELG